MGPPWLVPVPAAAATGAGLALLGPGPVRSIGWTALVLVLALVVATAPWSGPRRPWRWLGAGLGLLALSEAASAGNMDQLLPALPAATAPSVVLHLVAYLPLLVGVFRLTATTARPHGPGEVLDAVVVVLVAVCAAGLVVADGRADGLSLSILPLLDLALLASAIPLLGRVGRGPSQVLLLAGLGALVVSDTVVVAGLYWGIGGTGVASAVILLLGVLLLAVAARHPSSTRLARLAAARVRARADSGWRTPPTVTTRRLVLLALGLTAAPLLLLSSLLGLVEGAGVVPLAAFAVFALAAFRLSTLVAELVRHDADRGAQRRFAAAFDRSPGGLGLVALSGRDAGRLVEANSALADLLGLPAGQVVGTPVAGLVHVDDPRGAESVRRLLREVTDGVTHSEPVQARLAAPGRPRWGVLDLALLSADRSSDASVDPDVDTAGDATNGTTGRGTDNQTDPTERTGQRQGPRAVDRAWAVLRADDVTDRLDTEAQLARQARRDPLTGLANRLELLEALDAALLAPRPVDSCVVVLLIDLDRFKLVNDAHGHAVGDELLVDVASRLRRLRAQTIARLGGDEFALVARLGPTDRLDSLPQRIHAALEPVVQLSRGDVVVSASIGVVVHDGSQDAEGLLRQADIAMYRAKADGGRRHVVFGRQLQAEVESRHAVERELRAALTNGDLAVVYQPVVSLADLQVVGHEALVRLVRRLEGVTVGPSEFLEVAEESGLVRGMGGVVMSGALATAAADPLRRHMAVNVSGRELAEKDFAGRVLRRLGRAGLPPDRLVVEVTENAVVPYLDGVVPQLRRLRGEGVSIALDDFGTGYSSLTHLRALPVDLVKIDRSFVERVTVDGPDRRIVAAVAELVDGLGLQCVAEGIETRAQHEVVRSLGCTLGQGYLYGRPADTLVDRALTGTPTLRRLGRQASRVVAAPPP